MIKISVTVVFKSKKSIPLQITLGSLFLFMPDISCEHMPMYNFNSEIVLDKKNHQRSKCSINY